MKPHHPKPARTERPRNNYKTTINVIMFVAIMFVAITFVVITGCRWTELAIQYGSKSTAHKRFQDLQQKRSLEKNSQICKMNQFNKSYQSMQTRVMTGVPSEII